MQEKTPETFTTLTYLWVFGLSALGGIVSFARKVREGHARAWNFVEFIGEIVTSSFAGVMTFYLCEWSNFAPLLTAAMVGIAGHMGSRAIFLLEAFFDQKYKPSPKLPLDSEK
jgi:LydA holin phage, holin superfamily III